MPGPSIETEAEADEACVRASVSSSSTTRPDLNADPHIGDYEIGTEDGFLDVDLGDGCLPRQSSKIFKRSSAPYIAHQGMERYHPALRSLIPVRRKPVKKDDIGVDHAGLGSFILSTWLSKLMYKAHQKSLAIEDLPQGSPIDSCDINVQRLEMLWQEELRTNGPSGASFSRAVWRFVRTRLIADWLAFTASCILGFLTPMVFMRKLLEFAQDPESEIMTGLIWAFLLMFCELFRILFFSWRWVLSIRTATRLRVACQGMLYRKIIRLNHFEENYMGQLINMFANDSQRIFDMIVFGPMIIGGPMVLISGVGYVYCILGPWALLGILVFAAFYPVQYFLSRASGLLRGKTVQASDKRISLMSEILTYMKTIKMNAWEDCFEDQVSRTRANEQSLIQKTTYLSSLGTTLAPTVPIISSIVTFVAHVGSGNTLTAAQAFPALVFLSKNVQYALTILREPLTTMFEGSLQRVEAFSVQAVYSNSIRNVVRALQSGLSSFHEARIGLKRMQAFPFMTIMVTQARNFINVTQIGFANIFEACVGLKRIQRCLLIEEIQPRIHRPIDKTQAIAIGGATFTWGSNWLPSAPTKISRKGKKKRREEHIRKSDVEGILEEREKLKNDVNQVNGFQPILQGINFSASKGYLIGVCGSVGSGKTSLLLSILGQMRLINGQLAREGSCAYVSQQAWITNGTLRDNILFGDTFVSTRYYTVLNSCALNEDVNHLPGGDLTEIGERGVNLSGGQKQRIALARALYANRDIYLLDDPLSNVDINVGTHIFNNYIEKELLNKTVVLVTHNVQYLIHCDEVYVMKDGCIIERGTHEALLKAGKEYSSMIKKIQHVSPPEFEQPANKDQVNGHVKNTQELGKPSKDEKTVPQVRDTGETLTVDEPSNLGSLKTDTYCRYVASAGGFISAILVFAVCLANVGSTAFSSWWLATWIKAGGGNTTIEVNNKTVVSSNLADNPDYEFYQTIYASTIGFILLTCALRCLIFTKVTLRASSVLHNDLFQKIMHSPMLFFETNPIGRMQNIFSRDLDEVDSRLPQTVENIVGNLWIVAFAILFICIVFPWFFLAFIPISIIYYLLSRIFRKGIRDLKRLENTTRSPVFSNLVETLQGLNTIRAFNKEGDYIQRFFQLCDENATCAYLWNVGMRWLAVRIDLLAAVTMSITAFLVVVLHGAVAPAMAGLALSYSWHISGVLQYTTRLISEAEVRFISVERILAYIEAAVTEGKEKCIKPTLSWPNGGRIRFQNVCLSYRKNMANALHNVSFNILSGEKIGIVGRTGSGKSSLAVALFRLVELNNGRIKLDDVDIAEVPLSILRAKISIIPQDPVLFSGTIRYNLDPKSKCSDAELWNALTKTKLKEKISALPLKLETAVSSGSTGLSAGECQLLCLARALLTSSKVLILDEATASIDPETEAAVQLTIEEEFNNCTILIIAHHLKTVTKCDRILVMSDGKVVEFEEPIKLLADSNSTFAKMMASAEAL